MQLAIARYTLRFRQPFVTAHGVRSGTEAVFVRVEDGQGTGHGEAALPPYLQHQAKDIIKDLYSVDIKDVSRYLLDHHNDQISAALDRLLPPARAALSMALLDHRSRHAGLSLGQLLGVERTERRTGLTMATIAVQDRTSVGTAIGQLPDAGCVKVKVGFAGEQAILRAVLESDGRPVFLDANQGWDNVAHAMAIMDMVRGQRLLVGVEQPFAADRWDLHGDLQAVAGVPVFGDESLQGMDDLERAPGTFGGINIKGTKCGGPDRALALALRARELGLKVMLGCMSEGALGCAAMAQLQGVADLLDLDGPWLIANDPFKGLGMTERGMTLEDPTGIGVVPALDLHWT